MNSYNFMTPVDAANTRYVWFQTRNFAPGDDAVSAAMTVGIRKVFKEDQAVLKAVQIGHDSSAALPTSISPSMRDHCGSAGNSAA